MTEIALALYLRALRDAEWMVAGYRWWLWHNGWAE